MSGISATADTAPLALPGARRSAHAVLALSMIAAMFDGFDGQAIGFVAPAIAADWHLPKAEFGMIFSVGLFGLIVGAVLVAPLGDRLGRRAVAIAGAVMVALFTLVTALVRTPVELAVVRMLTGVGLGTLMPVLVTIAHEAAPAKLKGVFVTLLVTAFPFGSFVGGLGVAWGLQHGSWRDVFLVAGLVAALFPILFWLFLWPAPVPKRNVTTEPRTTVLTLFRERRWLPTTLLWTLFFASLLNTYMLGAWLPLLLERGGLDAAQAVRTTAGFGLGGTVGGIVLGLLATRFGGFVLALAYAVAAAALVAIGMADGALLATTLLAALVGAMIPGGHVGNNVIAARIYPAVMNATGVGWAQGLGRVGCVVGPAAVGLAVGRDVGNAAIFGGSACVALLGAAAAAGIALYERNAR